MNGWDFLTAAKTLTFSVICSLICVLLNKTFFNETMTFTAGHLLVVFQRIHEDPNGNLHFGIQELILIVWIELVWCTVVYLHGSRLLVVMKVRHQFCLIHPLWL